uniref:non-specific serine/threonine protein kinase n=1 Tax=Leersia perrieri TaxID=77586 RepID=A0A0D9W4V5_9ORYZ
MAILIMKEIHPCTSQCTRSLPHFAMAILLVLTALLSIHTPASSATTKMTNTISPGQQVGRDDKLVSNNGRYALGFFKTGIDSSQNTTTPTSWYLGIWFNTVPKLTTAWVANRDSPVIMDTTTSLELHLTLSHDGNLVILHQSNSSSSIIWSTQANITSNDIVAVLLDSGNLVLQDSSNSATILWQSFDYPTDTFFPGEKLGFDKVTGLNRRLVSWKNLIRPATGMFCEEMDPTGANQLIQHVLAPLNSSITYWSSGVWNGQYFPSVPEMSSHHIFNFTFVNNDQERYFIYSVNDEAMIIHRFLDTSGQTNSYIWSESSLDWVLLYAQPRAQCDVYANCGPFTICNDSEFPYCNCIRGFTVKSPKDWELDDRTGGCSRDSPLDCISNRSTGSTDMFYPMPCVRLPQSSHSMRNAASASECAQVCLSDCTCTAYFFGSAGCSVWQKELLNIRQQQCSAATDTNGETLYVRLAAKELQVKKATRKGMFIGVGIGASFTVLGFLAVLIMVLIISRNKTKFSSGKLNNIEDCNGIIAFQYIDLQHATKSFMEKLGGGSFGCVYKGFLNDSTAIAVKRLDHAWQGEKQFRAEVRSLGIIQHINLVKLIGFCCEGGKRLLVYEFMPNRSLDLHLFQSNNIIALGVARGLAYLHESFMTVSFIILEWQNFWGETLVEGTVGYLAPEWISGVAVTPKIDVYSYGMVMWEIISGDVASLIDNKLQGDADLNKVEIACKVACWCIQHDEIDRPTMGEGIKSWSRGRRDRGRRHQCNGLYTVLLTMALLIYIAILLFSLCIPTSVTMADTISVGQAFAITDKLVSKNDSRVLTTVRGTAGYLAPEWISGVPITPKVDVYSYGMVLLEIISGRRNSYTSCSCSGDHNVYFPVLVACKLLDGDLGGLVDYRLNGDFDIKEAEIVCKVACWCIQDNEINRPTMREVVQILEGLVEISMPPMPRLLQAIAGSSNSTGPSYSFPAN